MSRPYSADEVCELTKKFDPQLEQWPEIVGMTVLLLHLVAWLEAHKTDPSFPAPLQALLEAAGPALSGLLFTCEQGPYGDGVKVI